MVKGGRYDMMTNEEKWADKHATSGFSETASEIFAPLYPILAGQIIDECNVTDGVCIDIGSGSAKLAIELAARTNLTFYAVDLSRRACEIARKNIACANLNGRVTPVCGDVHFMPFENNFADLIVSRGSFLFWQSQVRAFREIYRTLKPNGVAFIGGGFGKDARVRDEIKKKLRVRFGEKEGAAERFKVQLKNVRSALREARISRFKVIKDSSGTWIKIIKRG